MYGCVVVGRVRAVVAPVVGVGRGAAGGRCHRPTIGAAVAGGVEVFGSGQLQHGRLANGHARSGRAVFTVGHGDDVGARREVGAGWSRQTAVAPGVLVAAIAARYINVRRAVGFAVALYVLVHVRRSHEDGGLRNGHGLAGGAAIRVGHVHHVGAGGQIAPRCGRCAAVVPVVGVGSRAARNDDRSGAVRAAVAANGLVHVNRFTEWRRFVDGHLSGGFAIVGVHHRDGVSAAREVVARCARAAVAPKVAVRGGTARGGCRGRTVVGTVAAHVAVVARRQGQQGGFGDGYRGGGAAIVGVRYCDGISTGGEVAFGVQVIVGGIGSVVAPVVGVGSRAAGGRNGGHAIGVAVTGGVLVHRGRCHKRSGLGNGDIHVHHAAITISYFDSVNPRREVAAHGRGATVVAPFVGVGRRATHCANGRAAVRIAVAERFGLRQDGGGQFARFANGCRGGGHAVAVVGQRYLVGARRERADGQAAAATRGRSVGPNVGEVGGRGGLRGFGRQQFDFAGTGAVAVHVGHAAGNGKVVAGRLVHHDARRGGTAVGVGGGHVVGARAESATVLRGRAVAPGEGGRSYGIAHRQVDGTVRRADGRGVGHRRADGYGGGFVDGGHQHLRRTAVGRRHSHGVGARAQSADGSGRRTRIPQIFVHAIVAGGGSGCRAVRAVVTGHVRRSDAGSKVGGFTDGGRCGGFATHVVGQRQCVGSSGQSVDDRTVTRARGRAVRPAVGVGGGAVARREGDAAAVRAVAIAVGSRGGGCEGATRIVDDVARRGGTAVGVRHDDGVGARAQSGQVRAVVGEAVRSGPGDAGGRNGVAHRQGDFAVRTVDRAYVGGGGGERDGKGFVDGDVQHLAGAAVLRRDGYGVTARAQTGRRGGGLSVAPGVFKFTILTRCRYGRAPVRAAVAGDVLLAGNARCERVGIGDRYRGGGFATVVVSGSHGISTGGQIVARSSGAVVAPGVGVGRSAAIGKCLGGTVSSQANGVGTGHYVHAQYGRMIDGGGSSCHAVTLVGERYAVHASGQIGNGGTRTAA